MERWALSELTVTTERADKVLSRGSLAPKRNIKEFNFVFKAVKCSLPGHHGFNNISTESRHEKLSQT